MLITAPLIVAILLFLGSLVWYSYKMYRGEYDKWATHKRLISSDQAKAIREKVTRLGEDERAALRCLAVEQHLGGVDIRERFPGVDFLKISGLIGILEHRDPPVDVWEARDADCLEMLRDAFAIGGDSEVKLKSEPFLVSLCRRIGIASRVIEAAWDAARKSEAWKAYRQWKVNHQPPTQ